MGVIVQCLACGAKNRIQENQVPGKIPVCGKCKRPLSVPAQRGPVVLNESNFDNFLNQASQPVLVDFFAHWCGPCKQLAPILEEFSRLHVKITVVKVDIDFCPGLSSRLKILSVPTLILFQNRNEVKRISGAMPLPGLEAELRPWL